MNSYPGKNSEEERTLKVRHEQILHYFNHYFNLMLPRFEELLYHELSGTSHKKVEMIGVDFIRSRGVTGNTAEEVVDHCIKEITLAGITQEIRSSIHGHGILLRLDISGCMHLLKDVELRRRGAQPYLSPVTNMIGDRLIEILSYEVFSLADMKIDDEHQKCIVKCAMFEDKEKIGQVSDWKII